MKKNIFKLNTKKLKDIALSLQTKVETGLNIKDTEVQCIPTYITPNTELKGKALVLDLGGTNYRIATVDFSGGKPAIRPDNGWKKDLSVMKTPGYTKDELFKEMGDMVSDIDHQDKAIPIGYCFSYPAESLPDGDAKLLRWTKGVDIKEMIGQPVGKPLMDYFNSLDKTKFSKIKVINDTVASLFAGLTDGSYDAYIGLIVGTGTNMATFIDAERIKKIDSSLNLKGKIPINLESGNFFPPHLTLIDDKVDAMSINKGSQRFEKAVSGMYLGELLKYMFPCDTFEENFDARKLTSMMSYPDIHKNKYVRAARQIYKRSAKLVAASLAGLILVLLSHDSSIKKICLTAEGSLFWSEDKNGKNYKKIVLDELQTLLSSFGYTDIKIDVNQMQNANLIGSAIAALS